jgi:hypothetical protein
LGSDLLEEEAIPPSPLSGGGGGGKNGASTGSKTDTPSASTVSEHSKAGGCSPSARSTRAGGGGVGPFGARVRPVLPVETGPDSITTPSTTSLHSSTAGAAMISTRLVAPPLKSSAFSVAIADSTESAWSFISGSRSTSSAVPSAASVRQLFAVMSRALASNSGRLRIKAATCGIQPLVPCRCG